MQRRVQCERVHGGCLWHAHDRRRAELDKEPNHPRHQLVEGPRPQLAAEEKFLAVGRLNLQQVLRLKLQNPCDVGTDDQGSRRGEGEERYAWHVLAEEVEVEVLLPEAGAPLRHAVRLIDRDEQQLACFVKSHEEPQEFGRSGALLTHVHDRERALRHGALVAIIVVVERRRPVILADRRRGLIQLAYLVFHQGEEGRDHHGHLARVHGRQLEAQALAVICRPDNQRVAPLEQRLHHLVLLPLEARVAKEAEGHFERVRRRWWRW